MLAFHPDELELFARISCDEHCYECDVTCALRKRMGVVIMLRGHPVGTWSAVSGRLQFNHFHAPHVLVADNIAQAMNSSLVMAKPH